MNNLLRRLLQSAVAVPLLLGPLSAQETAPAPVKETAPAEHPAAVEKPAAATPVTPAAETPADDSQAEENVSADNSLSFPVDI